MTDHLLVDISAHGLGHLAQTAPVLNEIRRRRPSLRLTVHSDLTRERLARRIAEPFHHDQRASDFGFVMHNAIDIDLPASATAYQRAHEDWTMRVATLSAEYKRAGYTAVLANAAYLPLAAAAAVGIPAIGMCSLNWADLFRHYFAKQAWAAPIGEQIYAAYNAANFFLNVTPGMPMTSFGHRCEIGPIAALASTPRAALRKQVGQKLGLDASCRWVLVAMGGMEFRLPVESWPQTQGVQWLCPAAWTVCRPDVRDFDGPQPVAFTDLLMAADAVLTKPGYGTFVEAACNGTPVLYVPRGDWPEETPIAAWLHKNVAVLAVDRDRVWQGDLSAALTELWQQPARTPPIPTGIFEAADRVLALLDKK